MKIRQGFVSNSSTCSFIVAVALLRDKDKFEKNRYVSSNSKYCTGKEILGECDNISYDFENTLYYYDGSSIKADARPEKEFVEKHLDDAFIVYHNVLGEFHGQYDYENHEAIISEHDEADEAANECLTELRHLVSIGAISNMYYDYYVGRD